MKILVASDLHGNAIMGEKLIERAREDEVSEIVLLGDIYYHGPRNPLTDGYDPMLLSEILNKEKDRLISVRGNCDSEVDEMISEFKFIDTQTIDYGKIKLTVTHGHIYSPENLPKDIGNVFVFGHIHIGFIEERDGIIIANPGSTTLPKGGTPKSYLIITDNKIILKNLVTGDIIEERAI